MNRLLSAVIFFSIVGLSALAQAACPTTNPQTIEAYVYGCPQASPPYASSLFVPAVPSSTTAPTSSLVYIPANLLVTLSDTQTLTNKTISCANNVCTVRLGSDVSGILPQANGGTGAASISAGLDSAFGSTQGGILYRGASLWTYLGPGTSGFFLETQGAGANPIWAAGGSGGGTVFSGTITSSSSTVYTATATGYTATAGNIFCTSSFTPTNGLNPTLNIASTGAKPIKLLTGTGLLSLANSEIPNTGQVCFMYDGTNEVLQTAQYQPVPLTTSTTVTPAMWASCQSFVISAASQTITLPASTGLPTGGCITIQTIGVTAALAPGTSSGDAINNGQIGGAAANTTINIPADLPPSTVIYSGTPGTSAFTIPLGELQYAAFSWGVGMDLSLQTGGIDFLKFSVQRIVYGISCKNATASGASQAMTFKDASNTQTIAAGTTIGASTFDMTTAAGSEVLINLTSAQLLVPVGYSVGATVANSSTTGSGRCDYSYR